MPAVKPVLGKYCSEHLWLIEYNWQGLKQLQNASIPQLIQKKKNIYKNASSFFLEVWHQTKRIFGVSGVTAAQVAETHCSTHRLKWGPVSQQAGLQGALRGLIAMRWLHRRGGGGRQAGRQPELGSLWEQVGERKQKSLRKEIRALR